MKLRISIHEALFLIMGTGVGLTLHIRNDGETIAWMILAISAAYMELIRLTPPASQVRLIAAYGVAWAFYSGSSVIVEAMNVPLRNQELLAFDALFHLPWRETLPAWANDILSIGYLGYHVYLHWVLVDSLFRDPAWRSAMARRLFTAFAMGFVGYFTFPAASPELAFSDLFTRALSGGFPTKWNAAINGAFAARYDAFPSLHTLITLTLLSWDWNHYRSRFRIMIDPSMLMVVATLALRLHYVADLLVSLILFITLHVLFERNVTRSVGH